MISDRAGLRTHSDPPERGVASFDRNRGRVARMTLGVITLAFAATPLFAATQDEAIPCWESNVSGDYAFPSRFVDVDGVQLHYVEIGEGAPILFVHGNPTWSYLWRNVLPGLKTRGRLIAVDLVGMGSSDKPDIEYSFDQQRAYLDAFIENLGLKNITLVIHDWGSALGFDYARRHPDNVRAIAFMEAVTPPRFPYPSYEAYGEGSDFQMQIRTPEGFAALMEELTPESIAEGVDQFSLRPLSTTELQRYSEPFAAPGSALPVARWFREIPIAGDPPEVAAAVEAYGRWMTETDIPMLHIHVNPGAINGEAEVRWLQDHVRNLTSVSVGCGSHFIQEDHPAAIAAAIAAWLIRLESDR